MIMCNLTLKSVLFFLFCFFQIGDIPSARESATVSSEANVSESLKEHDL